jgi:hypothetical protein
MDYDYDWIIIRIGMKTGIIFVSLAPVYSREAAWLKPNLVGVGSIESDSSQASGSFAACLLA